MGGRATKTERGDVVAVDPRRQSGIRVRAMPATSAPPSPPAPTLTVDDHLAALGTLANGVAHGIADPMTCLLLNLEHVVRQLRALSATSPEGAIDADDVRENVGTYVAALSHAIDGAQRVRDVARHLMTLAGGTDDARARVDVRTVVESALNMASHELGGRARVVVHFSEVPQVEANVASLARALLALFVNAAQSIGEATARDSREARAHDLRVATFDGGESVVIEIADSGAGMAPHVLARACEPFFTTKEGAPGLGLPVARGIVKSLGGTLTVQSVKDIGTTVRVVLPAAPRAGNRRRVLLVEPDPRVAGAMTLALEDDADVVVVPTHAEALERLRAPRVFDAIVCDVDGANPNEFYADILRVAPQAAGRLVFTSGGRLTPRVRELLDGARIPCLAKPLDEKAVRRAILRR